MRHLAPALVMIGCIAVIALFAWRDGIWVAGGAGAMAVFFWAWVRLETGVWVNRWEDVKFTVYDPRRSSRHQ